MNGAKYEICKCENEMLDICVSSLQMYWAKYERICLLKTWHVTFYNIHETRGKHLKGKEFLYGVLQFWAYTSFAKGIKIVHRYGTAIATTTI